MGVKQNIVWQTMWAPDLIRRNPVKYLAIVETLAEAVESGVLQPAALAMDEHLKEIAALIARAKETKHGAARHSR